LRKITGWASPASSSVAVSMTGERWDDRFWLFELSSMRAL
jgi:hypothetical protein